MKIKKTLIFIISSIMLMGVAMTGVKQIHASDGATLIKYASFDGNDYASVDRKKVSVNGGEYVKGVDGNNALRIINNSDKAKNYVDLGEFDIGDKSFSITFYAKVNVEKQIMPKNKYCALISNKDWSSYTKPGFCISTSCQDNTFKGIWVDFSTENNSEENKIRNLPNADGNWQAIAVVFKRGTYTNEIRYYVGGELVEKVEIKLSSSANKSASTGKNLLLGCDANLNYPCADTTFDEVKVYSGELSAKEVKNDALPLLSHKGLEELKDTYSYYLSKNAVTAEMARLYYENLNEIQTLVSNKEYSSAHTKITECFNDVFSKKNGKVLTSFNILSDIHYDLPGMVYEKKLYSARNAFNKFFPETKTLVSPGDFTKNGKEKEFNELFSVLKRFNYDNYIVSLGNHEVKQKDNRTFDSVKAQFVKKLNELGEDVENVYYDKVIDGYRYIVLSTESMEVSGGKADISKYQLDFLDSKLSENASIGKPVFVILHQPLDGTFPLSSDYPVGSQGNDIRQILKKYPQAILISGHLHNGNLDEKALIKSEYGYQFDCMSLWQNDLANQNGNYGYHVNVYADRVEILAVNVETDKQFIDYRYTKIIPLNEVGSSAEFSDAKNVTYKNASGTQITINGVTAIENTSAIQNFQSHAVIMELDAVKNVNGIRYLAGVNGITKFDLEYSVDGASYKGIGGVKVFAGKEGEYYSFTFNAVEAKYIKFVPLASKYMKSDEFKTSIKDLRVTEAK